MSESSLISHMPKPLYSYAMKPIISDCEMRHENPKQNSIQREEVAVIVELGKVYKIFSESHFVYGTATLGWPG